MCPVFALLMLPLCDSGRFLFRANAKHRQSVLAPLAYTNLVNCFIQLCVVEYLPQCVTGLDKRQADMYAVFLARWYGIGEITRMAHQRFTTLILKRANAEKSK